MLLFLGFLGRQTKKMVGSVNFLSLWILSHPGKLVIFGPLLLLVFLQNRTAYRRFLFSILLALGLSAWYFLPANLELPYTHFKDFVSHGYVNDFVPFSRLLYSQWGTNAPGWGDNSLSQQVGIAQWLAIVLSLFFWRKLWPYLLVFSLSIFLMLPQSKFIWDLPTLLQRGFNSLAVFVFSGLYRGHKRRAGCQNDSVKILALPGAALLIGLALYGNRNHLRINEVRFYDQAFFDNYTGVAAGWNEYLPIWVKEVDYVKSKDQLNTLYYPGWQVTVDGQKVAIKPGVNGLITFAVPPGDHQIAAKFLPTWWRYLAGLISLFSVLVLIWQLKKVIILGFLTLLAFGLRVYRLGTADFKEDEFLTVKAAAYQNFCRQSPDNCQAKKIANFIFPLLQNNETVPNLITQIYLWDFISDRPTAVNFNRAWPHLLTVAGFYQIFGLSEFTTRLPGAIAGALLVPVGFCF